MRRRKVCREEQLSDLYMCLVLCLQYARLKRVFHHVHLTPPPPPPFLEKSLDPLAFWARWQNAVIFRNGITGAKRAYPL